MKQLIRQLKKELKQYKKIVRLYSKRAEEQYLDMEEMEYYGAYLGKVELLEDLIPKLEAWK